jgi:DNA-binding MarR family transcriptional regulator
MNTHENHTENHAGDDAGHPGTGRWHHHPFGRGMPPFGPAMRDRMRAAFEDAGVTRRQWRILSALESAPSTAAAIDAQRDAASGPGRFGRRGFGPGFGPFGRGFGPGFGPHHGGRDGHRDGHRDDRRPTADVLAGLETRGWVQREDDTWSLTDAGSAELARIRESLDAARASLREGISDDDWSTAMSVLERVAQNSRR